MISNSYSPNNNACLHYVSVSQYLNYLCNRGKGENLMRIRKTVLVFLAVVLCIPLSAFAWDRSNYLYCDEEYNAPFTSNGHVLVRSNTEKKSFEYSCDGQKWTKITCGAITPTTENYRMADYNGRTFILLGMHKKSGFVSEDGVNWRTIDLIQNANFSKGDTDFYFQWTGKEYIACQNLTDTDTNVSDPRNNMVMLLDENFNLKKEYRFETPVRDVGYAYGVYYAEVYSDPSSGGYSTFWSSKDGVNWKEESLYWMPEETPEFAFTDYNDSFAGGKLFCVIGGNTYVSKDGIAFSDLGKVPDPASWSSVDKYGQTWCVAFSCDYGVVLRFYGWEIVNGYSNGPAYSGATKRFSWEELDKILAKPTFTYEAEPDSYASNGTVIVRTVNWTAEQAEFRASYGESMQYSYDGKTWMPVQYHSGANVLMMPFGTQIKPFNGRSFLFLDGNLFGCFSEDGINWFPMEGGGDWTSAYRGNNGNTFAWTGEHYLVSYQGYTGGVAGVPAEHDPLNKTVGYLDQEFNLIKRYDFGEEVAEVAYVDDVAYALFVDSEMITSPDGESTWVAHKHVCVSEDGSTWTKSDLTDIPAPKPCGFFSTEQTDVFAGPYLFRLASDGTVRASKDGVYWTAPLAKLEGEHKDTVYSVLPYQFPSAKVRPGDIYLGRDGVILDTEEKDYQWTVDEMEKQFSKNPIYVTLNKSFLTFSSSPYMKNDRVLVPLRNIAEALDFTVTWNKEDNTATCAKDGKEIMLVIGTDRASVNGTEYSMDAASELTNGMTFVPLRFLSEQFGISVEWCQETQTVVLTK
jgi:hypothetical protein